MGSVKRFRGYLPGHPGNMATDAPIWVLASDYDALERECEALREQLKKAKRELLCCNLAADGSSATDAEPSVQVAQRISELCADRDKLARKAERVREALSIERQEGIALIPCAIVERALANEEHPDFGRERRKGERRGLYQHASCTPEGWVCPCGRRFGRDRREAR